MNTLESLRWESTWRSKVAKKLALNIRTKTDWSQIFNMNEKIIRLTKEQADEAIIQYAKKLAGYEKEKICNNCHWFMPRPCSDWYAMEQEGLYGECRHKSPGDRGFPTTWGNRDCGDWKKRDRPPVSDPNPDWMKESIQKEKEEYEKKQALASKSI